MSGLAPARRAACSCGQNGSWAKVASVVRGLGVDVVELERIAAALRRRGKAFAARILTPAELAEAGDPPQVTFVAGRFAAKEAVAKALGTGVRGFGLRDIEVVRDAHGAPVVHLYNGARRTAEALGIEAVRVSVSHARTVAVAVAVAEGKAPCGS